MLIINKENNNNKFEVQNLLNCILYRCSILVSLFTLKYILIFEVNLSNFYFKSSNSNVYFLSRAN